MKHNLQPKFIMDFTPEDTIYIQQTSGSGNNAQSKTFLCQFVKYHGNRVFGTAISTDVNPNQHRHEIEAGLELSATLEKCALYGTNPVSQQAHYHWFMPSGYAIYPHEYEKESENSSIIGEHPAFGLIAISRRSSRGTVLFGSSITHNEIIALRINKASVKRQHSNEWYSEEEQIVEIELSSNQFAEFITTPNQGTGTPCTIRYIGRQSIPEPPYENMKDRFSDEFERTMKNVGKDLTSKLDILKAILEKPTVNKGDKVEILNLFNEFVRTVSDNVPFIEKQFKEQMEKTVTEAKGEIEAFINRRLSEAGRKVLLGETGDAQILLLPPDKHE